MLTLFLTVILGCLCISKMHDVYWERRTWKTVRQAAKKELAPGETITIQAPRYWNGSRTYNCTLSIHRSHSSFEGYEYRIDTDRIVEFSHSDVVDAADGDLIKYLKNDIYHGRWIVQ